MCNFGKFINFTLGTARSETVEIVFTSSSCHFLTRTIYQSFKEIKLIPKKQSKMKKSGPLNSPIVTVNVSFISLTACAAVRVR